MSRHAAPLSDYDATDRVARLHDDMFADAMASIAGLAAGWPAPDGRPYELSLKTGTMAAILAG